MNNIILPSRSASRFFLTLVPMNLRSIVLLSALTLLSIYASAQEVEAIDVPVLLTHIAGHKADGEVKIQDIERSRGIYVTEVDDDERWQVISYKLTFIRGERTSECLNKGANYSNNCKAYFSGLNVGNTVEVHDVKVQGKKGSIVQAPSLTLRIIP